MTELLAWLAELDEKTSGVLMIVLGVIATFVITWIVVRIVNRFFRQIAKKMEAKDKDASLTYVNFIRYLVIAIIYFVGILAAIGQVPQLKTIMTSALASTGIAAIVIGLAAQETLSNLVSGFIILAFKPFKVGDTVQYIDKKVVGVVEEISLRHTVIRTYENKRVLIPNGLVNKEVIENADYRSDRVSFFLDVDISFDSDVRLAMELIAQLVEAHPDFIDPRTPEQISENTPKVTVRISGFGHSSVSLRAIVFARDIGTTFSMKSDLYFNMLRAFQNNGIVIPYQTFRVEADDAERQ
jgi:small conductance mechanosensitive channel